MASILIALMILLCHKKSFSILTIYYMYMYIHVI